MIDDRPVQIAELFQLLWRRKLLVLITVFSFSTVGALYSLFATEYFVSEAVLAPAEKRSNMGTLSQLSGLASLAGISVGAGGSAETLAMLQSRGFIGKVVADRNLLPELYPDKWDPVAKRWTVDEAEAVPAVADGARKFIKDFMSVSEDKKTGIVRVSVRWTDPQTAASLTADVVSRLNDVLRQRAIDESEKNIEYLKSELDRTNVVSLQQSIGRLVDTELQKLMLAKGNQEFAFKMVDPPVPPRERDSPNRLLLTVLFGLIGGLLVFGYLLIQHHRTTGKEPTH